MLQASVSVKRAIPAFRLVFVGESHTKAEWYDSVREQVDDLGLSDCVTFMGFQPDIRQIESAADVFVLCSDREGLGQSVIEAMAMGLPVIATDAGGTPEILRDGLTGFVVPGGDAEALASRVCQVLTDQGIRERLAKAARTFVEVELDANLSAARTMEVYETVVARRFATRLCIC